MPIPKELTCVDCGGQAYLVMPFDPECPPQPGDVATYRCRDCCDRWDVVLTDDDLD